MGLIEAGRCQTSIASGGATFTPPDNESWRVRRLICVPSTNDTLLTLSIAGKCIGVLRVKGGAGNHAPFPSVQTAAAYEVEPDLFALARSLGAPLDIPVANGENIALSRYAEAGRVGIVYDAYDAPDVKAEEANGSKCKVRTYLHYLTNSAAITASTARTTLDTSRQPTGLETWPVGGVRVPSNAQIELLAILGSASARGNGSAAKGATTQLWLVEEDGTVLLDPTGAAGIPFLGDATVTTDAETYKAVASLIGAFTAEQPKRPLILTPPMVYPAGSTLAPSVATTGAASGGIAASGLDVALLLRKTWKS